MAAPVQENLTRLDVFKGLNNVEDPMRGGWGFQSVADNVNGTDSGGMELREGYMSFAAGTAITGAYTTFDFSRMFIVDAGSLKRVYEDGTTQTLYSGIAGVPYWTEVNDTVYLSCGEHKLQIELDNVVRQWGVPAPTGPDVIAVSGNLPDGVYQACLTYTDSYGREGGPGETVELLVLTGGLAVMNIPQLPGYVAQLYVTEGDGTVFYLAATLPIQTSHTIVNAVFGRELVFGALDEPPSAGAHVAVFGASIYIAEYMAEAAQTIIWFSQPFGYHLFDLSKDYFIVPGEVTQLFGTDKMLLITTQTRVFIYDGARLQQLAEYGAVQGQHADPGTDEKVYFWTKRGLCRAMPFENITETRVSVAPGVSAGGVIVDKNGCRKYIATIRQGGSAYNAR